VNRTGKTGVRGAIPARATGNFRSAYEHGVADYYEREGSNYSNPHEPQVRTALRLLLSGRRVDTTHVLDLACGSGEITRALLDYNAGRLTGKPRGPFSVLAVDPYTGAAFQQALAGCDTKGTTVVHRPYSFENIAAGLLSAARISTVICSYAMHLLEPSRLPVLLHQLAVISPSLVILSPHKKPVIDHPSWRLSTEDVVERVHVRVFKRVEQAC